MKLPRDGRRSQLLDTALQIVREQGADELTLGTLAQRADVSRPVVYDHFSTRAGLLLALFQRLEDNYVRQLRQELSLMPGEPAAVADAIAAAYFSCLTNMGQEGPAIFAALQGSPDIAVQQSRMLGEYVAIVAQALQPFSAVSGESLRLLCTGLLGAAEAIARELQAGKVTDTEARTVFAKLIIGSLRAA
ncbi:TetR/AcrR family transcriptional regulator [Aminobacter ciceronei]|uniref:AcrR family transcriptional regulator n=1 Tax=Aminobacter ciceronei TaxID=150723 RepID=A0ABR6C7T4_9HYPH|nr:TetR/AcrR family transcriptional regulator [Aminobacter ciceronei]MBA8907143.1 AcrR family transcriptional regulator [Aminobacter ciceronei]MBA9021078.1 AcrR family transcriptional regulator [Aminobacter ciceronei]